MVLNQQTNVPTGVVVIQLVVLAHVLLNRKIKSCALVEALDPEMLPSPRPQLEALLLQVLVDLRVPLVERFKALLDSSPERERALLGLGGRTHTTDRLTSMPLPCISLISRRQKARRRTSLSERDSSPPLANCEIYGSVSWS